MPEHVHWLISEPARGNPSTVLQALKARVSRALRSWLEDAPSFWQRRFYDLNIWRTKKIFEKLEYMDENPVKRGIVVRPNDWPCSSWTHYATEDEACLRSKDHHKEKNASFKHQRVRQPAFRQAIGCRRSHPRPCCATRSTHNRRPTPSVDGGDDAASAARKC